MNIETGRQHYKVAVIEDSEGEYRIFKKRILDHGRLEFCSALPPLLDGVAFRDYIKAVATNCFNVDIFIVDWDLKRRNALELLQELRRKTDFNMTSRYWIVCSKNDGDNKMIDAIHGFFKSAGNYFIGGKDLLKGNYYAEEKLRLNSNLPWPSVEYNHFNKTIEIAINYVRSVDAQGLFEEVELTGNLIELNEPDDTFYDLDGDGTVEIPHI